MVGVLCTAMQYAVLVLGVEQCGLGAVGASAVGFMASATVNYFLNRRFTYASNLSHSRALWIFGAVVAAGLALNVLFMRLLHGYLGWHYVQAQILTTMITLVWHFTAHQRWTFSDRGPSLSEGS